MSEAILIDTIRLVFSHFSDVLWYFHILLEFFDGQDEWNGRDWLYLLAGDINSVPLLYFLCDRDEAMSRS